MSEKICSMEGVATEACIPSGSNRVNPKEYLKNEATAIRNENEVIPESLKGYIEGEFKKKIKEACQSKFCTRMCDGEIGLLVGKINNGLKSKRRRGLNNISEGLDENGNMIHQENVDATKKYIDRIIDQILETNEILRLISGFLQAVGYWKNQSLLIENDEPSKGDFDIEEFKEILKALEAEAVIKVNEIVSTEKENIKRRLLDAYERYRRKQLIQEGSNKEPHGYTPTEDNSNGR